MLQLQMGGPLAAVLQCSALVHGSKTPSVALLLPLNVVNRTVYGDGRNKSMPLSGLGNVVPTRTPCMHLFAE